MLTDTRQPIIAIATAPGRGAVGIVRLSGLGLAAFTQALLGQALQPRHATYLPFTDADGVTIDQGIALWFPAPHSYTGEDVLELQAHGGPVILQLLQTRCLQLAQQLGLPLRLAQAGEFTQRAFLNDKLDLAQAESVADLINASTQSAAKSAARALSGAFSAQVDVLLQQLIELRMLVEAQLDFPEEDVGDLHAWGVPAKLHALSAQVQRVLATARQGQLLREGLQVVIAGQPNVGKSSLLNALAGSDVAIVTPIAGTTRDKVEQALQIEGVPLHVIDTAGLRHTQDAVEQIGIERAWQAVRSADIVLFVHDLARAQRTHPEHAEYAAGEAQLQTQLQAALGANESRPTPVIHIGNKADALSPTAQQPMAAQPADACALAPLCLSAKTGAGLDALRARILQLAGWQSVPEGVFTARARHIHALQDVLVHLQRALVHGQHAQAPLDLLAEELRLAQNALGSITGAFSADDLLGVIFSQFCIGK